ncbi:O-antigen ligase domain-containing protein [Parabacteroides sp. PF5-9]|uniref:O-antigen ligase domain-containing protein n=1 Tax=Parabacteroides sp. PF5-9 TaxID=1742404 RepID=UPI0024731F8B|nr:O-antigen ligase domain-containing protein [Parabacteroides sp. PF5-9]MDH6358232.1 signal transduction histidine kinase [Parabacteroides sp. PF5-9]
MIQEAINKSFYYLFLFTLVFGVVLYDTLGFSYTDEICTLLLMVLYFVHVYNTKDWGFNRLFAFVLGVFLFYLVYSFYIGSNVRNAIIMDFVIQLKPYIGFFCVYAICPKFTKNQKLILRQVALLFSLYLLVIGVIGFMSNSFFLFMMQHESRFATAVTILAVVYLYCGDYSAKDKLIYLLILSIGLISGRSKFYGFYALSIFVVLFVHRSFEMKFNVKNIVFLLVIIAGVLFVARDKITLYFVEGGFGSGRQEADLYARMALYYFSLELFANYFPFGTGFATYGTWASSEYYSKIYNQLGMDQMHGLTENASPNFIADTYYPALAQFGVVGAVLFFIFWIHWLIKTLKGYRSGFYQEGIIGLLIIAFFLIECTSDATITHNRGLFMMMMLALLLSDMSPHKVNPYPRDAKKVIT